MSRLKVNAKPAVFVVLFAVSSTAYGLGPRVIFSNIATSPTSDVPGLPGVKFMAGTGSANFDRPFVSPDGTKWILGAATNLAAAENEVIIVGGGDTSAGSAVVVREGTATFFDNTINYGIFGTQLGINNAGQYAFSADTSAATGVDQIAARWNGASFDLIAREGTQAVGQAAGVGYGSSINATHILDNGDVQFRTAALTGATTQQVLYRQSSISTGSILAQTDITTPTGQMVAPDQTIDNLTSDRFVSSSSGAATLYHCDLNGPTGTDAAVVFNGSVVAQEGAILPGSSYASNVGTTIGAAGAEQVSHNGAYYMFRGTNADAIDWVVRNGAVVAETDQPIYTGATELYDDATFAANFFMNVTNGLGDYVIGGTTNAADANANAVLVLNSTQVVVRENDPVDLDGNGLFDDGVFIGVFNNDDAFLTDDLMFHFMANLRDAAGTTVGQAYLVMQVPEPASILLLAGAMTLALRRTRRSCD